MTDPVITLNGTTNISAYGREIIIDRGRSRELDDFPVGRCYIRLRNTDRTFDPTFSQNGEGLWLMEDGASYWLMENGSDRWALETTDEGTFGDIAPGGQITVDLGSARIFTGVVESIDYRWDVGGYAEAEMFVVDALGLVARTELPEHTATFNELPGSRISANLILAEVGLLNPPVLGAGFARLADDLVAAGTNTLARLNLIARTDGGWLYADRLGSVRYDDRTRIGDGSPLVTFADGTTLSGLPFSSVAVRFGGDLHFTRVTVTRTGGTPQTATTTDAAALAKYGVRSTSVATLHQTDADALGLAEELVGKYAQPEAAISELTIFPDRAEYAAQRDTVRALEIGDRVRVAWTPQRTGTANDQSLVIEGVRHELAPGEPHRMVLRLANRSVEESESFILGSATFGVLGSSKL